MSSMIDPSHIIPKYYQLASIIRQQVEEGRYNPHDPIPSERQLELQYSLSRPTIRQAIDLLERQGYLYRVHGKGTFVSPPKLQKGMHELTSFTEDMLSRGLVPGHKLLMFEEVIPPEKIAHQLEINDPLRKVLRIKRLRFGSDIPIGIQDSYLAIPSGQKILRSEIEESGSIYAVLKEKFGLYPTEADETLEVTLASPDEADMLQIPVGSPLLLNERLSWTQNRQAFEFVRILYRGDRYKYYVRLTRQP